MLDKKWEHERFFNRTFNFNFAILRTKRPIPAAFAPVEFEADNLNRFQSELTETSGCTEITALFFNSKSELFSVDVKPSECTLHMGFWYGKLVERMCFFSYLNKRRFGSASSPIICRGSRNRVLKGIGSFYYLTEGSAEIPDTYAVYTVIGKNREWIKDTLKQIEDSFRQSNRSFIEPDCPANGANAPTDY